MIIWKSYWYSKKLRIDFNAIKNVNINQTLLCFWECTIICSNKRVVSYLRVSWVTVWIEIFLLHFKIYISRLRYHTILICSHLYLTGSVRNYHNWLSKFQYIYFKKKKQNRYAEKDYMAIHNYWISWNSSQTLTRINTVFKVKSAKLLTSILLELP